MERFNPLETDKPKASQVNAGKFTEVATRNSVDDVSKCVECGKQMRLLECNEIPCFVCLEHRVSFPCKDA